MRMLGSSTKRTNILLQLHMSSLILPMGSQRALTQQDSAVCCFSLGLYALTSLQFALNPPLRGSPSVRERPDIWHWLLDSPRLIPCCSGLPGMSISPTAHEHVCLQRGLTAAV